MRVLAAFAGEGTAANQGELHSTMGSADAVEIALSTAVHVVDGDAVITRLEEMQDLAWSIKI